MNDSLDMSDSPAPGTIEHLKRSLIFIARNPWQAHIGRHRDGPESIQDESQMSLLDRATRDYIGLERRFAGNTIQMVTVAAERDQVFSRLDQVTTERDRVVVERDQITTERDMLLRILTPANIQHSNLPARPIQKPLLSVSAPAAKDIKKPTCHTDCWRERTGKPCNTSTCKYWHEYQTARWETIRSTLPDGSRVVPAARKQADPVAGGDTQNLLDAMGG